MLRSRTILAAVVMALAGLLTNVHGSAATAETTPKTSAKHKIDLNSASQEELMELPGVGEVNAKKIIANRPYKSTQDLTKAGLSENLVNRIAGFVTVKSSTAARAPRAASADHARGTSTDGRRAPTATSADGRRAHATPSGETSAATSKKLDLNTATEAQLQELPGVGPAYARRIVENRPYSTVRDLSMAGLPPSTIDKISGLVTVSHTRRAPAATAPSRSPQPTATEPAQPRTRTPRSEAAPSRSETPRATTPPATRTAPRGASSSNRANAGSSNQVWLNTDSNIYHKQGSRFYGNTKSGKYVTEDEAIRLGARPAENE